MGYSALCSPLRRPFTAIHPSFLPMKRFFPDRFPPTGFRNWQESTTRKTLRTSSVFRPLRSAILEGKSPTIFGDGEQTRDFCYVGDVVRANLLAATAPSEKACGAVFNIAGGRQYTLNTLLQMLQSVMGTQVTPNYAAPRAGDIRHSGADISRAEQLIGCRPATNLEEGLRLTVEAYRKA